MTKRPNRATLTSPADMSVPPEQRHRKRKTRGSGKGRISQTDHANHSEQGKRRREFYRKGRE